MTLGEKIKTLRINNNLSQEQLAEKLNVSRQAITKWENDVGIPDINNLQNITKLFNMTIDYLVNNIEDNHNSAMREDIDIDQYEKNGNCRGKYDAVVKAKFPNAKIIYPLVRGKKLNKMESIVDFIVQPGVLQVVDSLNNMDGYYLVENSNNQLLVRVSKTFIEYKILNDKFEGKKYVLDGNIFKKMTYTL